MKALVVSNFYLRKTLLKKGDLVELTPEQFDEISKKNCVKEASKSEQRRIIEQSKVKADVKVEDKEMKTAPKDRMLRPRRRSGKK